MEFKELMTGFASKLGIVGLDVDEERTFLEIDGMKVEVFQDEKANTMMLCGIVGDGPAEETPRWNALLLQANFLFLETSGATLAQNPETKQYILERALPLESLDVPGLIVAMESFVNQLERWKAMLEDFCPFRGTAEKALQEMDAIPVGSGFIRA